MHRLWGTLYDDDARIVLQSPEGLERVMTVTIIACSAFGITVSEVQDGDHVPADPTWGLYFVLFMHPARFTKNRSIFCTWAGPSTQIDNTVSRQGGVFRGLGVRPSVLNRNMLSPECALTVDGVDVESRGDRVTTLRVRNVEPEQA